jgi:hypothetical protein
VVVVRAVQRSATEARFSFQIDALFDQKLGHLYRAYLPLTVQQIWNLHQ